jgi:hypothetical protein
LERGVDLGEQFARAGKIFVFVGDRPAFVTAVSFLGFSRHKFPRPGQRLAQLRDRREGGLQVSEVAIPHQFGLAERSCASEDGLTSALLHIRHVPLQFGDAPVRFDERPVAQLFVAHQNQIQAKRAFIHMPRDRSPRSPNHCRPAEFCDARAFKQVRQLNCRCSAVSNAATWVGGREQMSPAVTLNDLGVSRTQSSRWGTVVDFRYGDAALIEDSGLACIEEIDTEERL